MSSKLRSIERARDAKAAKESVRDVQVSYGQLLGANSSGALGALLSQRFPGRLMQFVKLGEAVMAELKTLDAAKTKLIEQHGGKLNTETGQYDFGSKQRTAAVEREHKELLDGTIAIKAPRLSEDELERSSLTPGEVLQLMWLVKDPTE